ncbi:hypothetical protein [uncultured Thiodictyon sp.]|jgi:hypothetical protein|uniref:hypothetical protein n=1 Tax=uncultured Thiodictyon sp. TaxID=1846217 RepID=UPI0025E94328|nr:hypothetical protein [uncultured Thiodictyon sp.]
MPTIPALRDQTDHIPARLLAALRRERLDPTDAGYVVHELHVRQIERELQNRSATQRRGAKRNHDFLKKRHLGYLYEIPLLVLIITLLSTILWPLLSGPWRLVLGVMSGISVLLLLWYHRSR